MAVVKFEYTQVNEDGSKEDVVGYIEQTEKPPMSLFAAAQPLVDVQWVQLQAALNKVDRFETFIKETMGLLDNNPELRQKAKDLLKG